MRIVPLHHSTLSDWVSFLPETIYIKLRQGNCSLYAAGVLFLQEPQGAIVWEEKEEEWILLMIIGSMKRNWCAPSIKICVLSWKTLIK